MRIIRALRPVLRREVLARNATVSQFVTRTPARQHARFLSAVPQAATHETYDQCVRAHSDGLALAPPPSKQLNSKEYRRTKLPYVWLRDNCRCSTCVNQDTMQRNLNTFEIRPGVTATRTTADHSGVNVEWDDGHKSRYDWDFLVLYMLENRRDNNHVKRTRWGSDVQGYAPTVQHDHVMSSEDGVAKLTAAIMDYGFVHVTGVPHDDPNETKKLLERIAFIRETHYGGFYDFKPDLAMADTAYTNLALAPHTDTTYFTEPAGLQAFHLLSHESEDGDAAAEGGKTILVDGHNVAQIMKTEDPEGYRILSQLRLPWHASGNEGITLGPDQRYPVFQHDDDGKLHRIRWNNDDRGVVPFDQDIAVEDWYKAAARFNSIVNRQQSQYIFQMVPGKVLIFDNWRVFHGRTAFKGIRRICGGYTNRDDFVSRWMNTNFGRKASLKRVMGG